MLCSRLSVVRPLLSDREFATFEQYLASLSPNSKLTTAKVSLANGIDFGLTQKILQELVKEKIFKYAFGLRCPVCGLLLDETDDVSSIKKEHFCYQCDEMVEITPEDVEVIYIFNDYPFVRGQQIKIYRGEAGSAALTTDTLAQLVASGAIDLNAAFFSPTDQEYYELQTAYNSLFKKQVTIKDVGDCLEGLVIRLFNLCHHFCATPIRLHPNQIDCYVRNTLYIPGISQANCTDGFVIECKNEAKAPSIGYMNKLHSILRTTEKQFGIIVSKCVAPKTFMGLANDIFLHDRIIIISIDADDLKGIIFQKINLLEHISRKMDEVRLNATKDLKSLGLYSG